MHRREKSIIVKDSHQDPCTNHIIADQLNSDAFAAIPFIAKEKTMGVLIVDQQFLPHKISADDLPMVETLADLTAVAMANASLIKRMEGFGDIAHQLRSPLMDIRGRVQLIMDGKITDTSRIRDYYQTILGVIESFESSINQMLSLQKIDAGLFEFNLKESSLTSIINKVVASNRYNSALKSIEIIVTLRHKNDLVWADELKLASALQALLENAIKFSYENSSVHVQSRDDHNKVYIAVIDKGRGINENDIPHLGERHYRGRNAQEERIDGIGLGLKIVKYIVDGHKGQLHIESKIKPGQHIYDRDTSEGR